LSAFGVQTRKIPRRFFVHICTLSVGDQKGAAKFNRQFLFEIKRDETIAHAIAQEKFGIGHGTW
jgi:hypothetical protein